MTALLITGGWLLVSGPVGLLTGWWLHRRAELDLTSDEGGAGWSP